MRVIENEFSLAADDGEQNFFRRPPLMRRNNMLEAH